MRAVGAMKRPLRLIASMLVSAVALWLARRQVPMADLLPILQQIRLLPLLLSLVLLAGTMWTKIERWTWLLDEKGQLPRGPLATALLIGYLGNVVLPARLGEVVRAYALSERTSIMAPQALSTVIVEKVLDIGTLLAFLVVLSMAVPLPYWAGRAGIMGGFVFLGFCAILLLTVLASEQLLAWTVHFRSSLPLRLANGPWWSWLRAFVLGFAPLRSPAVAGRAILWSLFSWLLGGLVNLCVLWGFGITPLLPAATLTLVTTNLGMVLPSVPGYIGVHHYLSMLALSVFAVPSDLALAYAIVIHALIFGSFALAGSLAVVVSGLNWRTFRPHTEGG